MASTVVNTAAIVRAKTATTETLETQTRRISVELLTRSITQPKIAKTGIDNKAVGTPKNKLTIIEPGIWNSELKPMLIISSTEKTETLTAVNQETKGNVPPYKNGNPKPNRRPRSIQLTGPRGQNLESNGPGTKNNAIIDPIRKPSSVTVR